MKGRSTSSIHAFKSFGWTVKWADIDDLATFEQAISPKTKAIFIESIANPGGVVTDIEAIAAIAKRARRAADRRQHPGHALPLPPDRFRCRHHRPFDDQIHRRPRQLGRRHDRRRRQVQLDGVGSATRCCRPSGRNTTISCSARPFGNFALAIACRVLGLRDLGPAISPFNSFLIATGCETLPLRMQKHSDNARAVAEYLAGHDRVNWVSYAGMPGDRYHELAKKYCPKGAGAVLTFGIEGGGEAGKKLVSGVKLFSHLANIGDTRSLIIHPWSTTHSQLSEDQKSKAGAGPEVVRLSVGIEDVADIVADLDQALAAI